jgi:hypothetical protein
MGTAPQRVICFPAERVARPAAIGASRLAIWKGRLREYTGRTLSRLNLPGAITNAEIKDNLTGQQISVEVGSLYVRLSIDGRDYYFDRITGRFDGTGAVP